MENLYEMANNACSELEAVSSFISFKGSSLLIVFHRTKSPLIK